MIAFFDSPSKLEGGGAAGGRGREKNMPCGNKHHAWAVLFVALLQCSHTPDMIC